MSLRCWFGWHDWTTVCARSPREYPARWMICVDCGLMPAFPFEHAEVLPDERCELRGVQA